MGRVSEYAMENMGDLKLARLQEAQELHTRIMATGAIVAQGMVDFSKMLLEMQTTKLYEELGYDNFGDYVERKVGIKQRQAYTYISNYKKLGTKLIEQNAQIGVTKLDLLTQISAPDREDFIEQNDLEGMSVGEIKAQIEQINGLTEQISMLEDEKNDAEAHEKNFMAQLEKSSDEIASLKAKINELNANREETEERIKLSLAADRALQEEEKQKAIEEAKAEERKAAREAFERKLVKERADAREKAKEEISAELAHENSEAIKKANAEREEAIAKAEKLTRELSVTSNEQTVKFSIYFNQMYEAVKNMKSAAKELRKAGSEEQADKLCGALRNALSQIEHSF